MSAAKYPRRSIALGPPYDDGTVPGEESSMGTRVQFGDDGIRLVEDVPSLTVERLAALLHTASAGCYEDDRCLEPEHQFRPSGNIHTFDATTLLPMLAPYLHRAPGASGD